MTAFATTLLNDPDWASRPDVRWTLTSLYLIVLALISVYGLHRYWLVYLFYKHRNDRPRPQFYFKDLPRVTVQLPMYNEANVARRVIDAACATDYPADKLQIQVLDDSTDSSKDIARQRVEFWARRGVNIQYIHRTDRTGYKAGALEAGLKEATGELVAIFDADFVPQKNFLRRCVHYFSNEDIGMVQARWGHINRDNSMLTRAQAIFLDGHFVIEHTSRNRAGRWINFNGTAGMWRKAAIEEAGGWQHDTLTEDVDLSYRAQMAGWKFIFLPHLVCPAELPPEINAFKAQQHRWTKGSIQTAKKLLWGLLKSRQIPLRVKIEAFFHLTSPMVYLYMTLMVMLFFPAIYVNMQPVEHGSMAGTLLGLSLFSLGTVSAGAFYIASQRAQKRSLLSTVAQIPVLMSVGVGISPNNARACIEALAGHESAFVRTPKYNATGGKSRLAGQLTILPDGGELSAPAARRSGGAFSSTLRIIPTPSIKMWMSLLEIAMGVYMLACINAALDQNDTFISVPFLFLFAAGYFYVGLSSLWHQTHHWRTAVRNLVLPQPG